MVADALYSLLAFQAVPLNASATTVFTPVVLNLGASVISTVSASIRVLLVTGSVAVKVGGVSVPEAEVTVMWMAYPTAVASFVPHAVTVTLERSVVPEGSVKEKMDAVSAADVVMAWKVAETKVRVEIDVNVRSCVDN